MLAAGILLLPTVMASGPAQATKPAASTYTVLYSFTGSPTDGANPEAGVIRDTAGNLYGTTYYGGASSNCKQGCGTVFKVTASGTETVLHNFTGYQTGDGASPYGGLILDKAGNLYGTTYYGGASSNCGDVGCGAVFKLTPSGTETVLYSFAGYFTDGAFPAAGLVRDKTGNLYGTTNSGGSSVECANGCGVVFMLTPAGTETLLEVFGVTSAGQYPDASLIRDTAGNLYGTTAGGGSSNCPSGCGTVFKLPRGGGITEVLYSLAGGSFGFMPAAPLLRDAIGNVYGTTEQGGASGSFGTVFKLTPSGAETVLHSFAGAPTDGANPLSGLIEDSAGNFYGTTYSGGASGFGTVYKLHP